MRRLVENVDWQDELDRAKFIPEFVKSFSAGTKRLANVYDVFAAEHIELLLADAVDYEWEDGNVNLGHRFVALIERAGYRHKPDLGEDGQPLLRRTTPLHLLFRSSSIRCRDGQCLARRLFRIYDRIDTNYVDVESTTGLTHFHVACKFQCIDVVERFLALGRVDPNGFLGPDSPLCLALRAKNKRIVELLLDNGADPNLADAKGSTPLHMMSKNKYDSFWAEILLERCNEGFKPVRIDARDRMGNTPLLLALSRGHRTLVDFLLRRGADPNLASAKGLTPLHLICGSANVDDDDDDSLKTFFEISDEFGDPRRVRIDAQSKVGNTALHVAVGCFGGNYRRKSVELLLRRGADPNLANAKGESCLHVICRRNNDDDDNDDTLKIFFEINDEVQRTLRLDVRDKRGNAPLHLALLAKRRKAAELLMNRGADLKLANADGSTPLHLLFLGSRPFPLDFVRRFFEISDARPFPVEIDARDKKGNTPLHLAVRHIDQVPHSVELMERGADLNLADADGSTTLHLILQSHATYGDPVTMIMMVASRFLQRQPPSIEARNKRGQTPLHLALLHRHRMSTHFLLSRYELTDPNLADADGHTPLHVACWAGLDDQLAERFFRVYGPRLRVDARDAKGRTPLYMALNRRHRSKLVELLLRHGADPNSVDEAEGLTPLHILSKHYYSGDRAKMFFEICAERNQVVRIDVEDELGRTPLQWAVAKLLPSMVDILLDRGADLSNFVFPNATYFAAKLKPRSGENSHCFKLRLASGALACVDHLARRGYELEHGQALMIMKTFKDCGLWEEPLPAERWYDDDEAFATQAREIRIGDLTLHELIRLSPGEAEKRVAYQDYFELWHQNKLSKLAEARQAACCRHLCEMMAGRFYRGWTLYQFWEKLIWYRLPLECCEMILENLSNQDLYNVCLAAASL
ncbi:unnamed protein product [Trichogramma brassicae]|uniref:Uncharacterized protein n=1 Tax=Trichogramma brassicae TaxID=86971 RepID=A0A6H5I2Q6_9HYME|nr:unnamed protein product [Trichogramma brassicae]